MNSKNKFVYLDRLTKSINPIHHKLINEIFLTDSIASIYNELLPSLPADVLKKLYINIKNNLYLFNPEQIEKLKPVVTFYTNIKFPCSTQCNPVNNPNRLRLRDKEYGTKKDCLSKCDKKVSINDTTLLIDTFLSFEDKLQYLISINKKELISTIQEKDIYNTDNIITYTSPLEKEYRPYVIITYDTYYKKNPDEYKNVKYLLKTLKSEEGEYDVIYEGYNNKETIIDITYSNEYKHTGMYLVLNGKPLTKKETIYLNLLILGSYNHPLGDSLSKLSKLTQLNLGSYTHPLGDSLSKLTQLKGLGLRSYTHPLGDSIANLTQLETLYLGSYNHPLGDSLSKLTQLKILNLESYNHPLGDSLSKLTQLKELNLRDYNHPLGDSLSKLTQLEKLIFIRYNKPLGDSLSKLTHLKELNLNGYTHHPLDSLSKLTQLKMLNLLSYIHPLGDRLSNLTQLEFLSLVSYNHPLGDSLSKLTQLKMLNLNYYKHTLGDSLSKLTQLTQLNLNSYTHSLGNSLSNLRQLKELTLDGTLNKRDDGKPIFAFKTKNLKINNDKKTKKELRDMDFDQLKQRIKDLRREGYKISILSKLEDKDRNRKLLRKIIRETEKG